MRESFKLKWALPVGAVAAVAVVGLRVLVRPSSERLEAHQDAPVSDYEAALARFEQLRAREAAMGSELNPVCLSSMLTYGHKTEHAIVLMHGLTNCPAQFRELAPLLYERGYNVLIPRMPGNGLADPETRVLKDVTAEQLRDCCADMLDLAGGLGEHITYLGLSVGGTMAAWAAQNRTEVGLAVVIAPAFTIARGLGPVVSRLIMDVLRLMPNLMTQRFRPFTGAVGHNYHGFATRGLAQTMRLGFAVYDAAKCTKPAAQSILVITNAADPAVDNAFVQKLVRRWQASGMQRVSTYEFGAIYRLIHDLIDPNQQGQQTALVYPILLDLITGEQVASQG